MNTAESMHGNNTGVKVDCQHEFTYLMAHIVIHIDECIQVTIFFICISVYNAPLSRSP